MVFFADMTADESGRINSEVYSAIFSAQTPPNTANPIGQHYQCRWIMTQNILHRQPKILSRQRN